MHISTFQITQIENTAIQIHASTLDDMTRVLPQGFYTTFSTLLKGTRVLGLHSHLQRLYGPAAENGIVPSVDEITLRKRLAELARMNLPNESRLRIILTMDQGSIYIGTQPFVPLPKTIFENGVQVITSELNRQNARIKDSGFILSSADLRKRINKVVFEVLLKRNENILEGMTSNFYAVKKGTLLTARNGILLGVTRRVILRLARQEGMSIDYRAPKITEKFDEAFLTSSSRGVVPIVSIDNHKVGQGRAGKWTKLLSKHYQTYLEKHAETIIE